MKKDALLFLGLIGVVISFLLFGGVRNLFLQDTKLAKTQARISETVFEAEVARTTQERSQGLANRQNLATSSAMLFVFDKDERFSFWMKNVIFPLDMIWIDKDKKIADITHNAQPESGKADSQLRIYKSAVPVRYVLEVNAGTARDRNFRIGQDVNFTLP